MSLSECLVLKFVRSVRPEETWFCILSSEFERSLELSLVPLSALSEDMSAQSSWPRS